MTGISLPEGAVRGLTRSPWWFGTRGTDTGALRVGFRGLAERGMRPPVWVSDTCGVSTLSHLSPCHSTLPDLLL